jgi:hypothetical protein
MVETRHIKPVKRYIICAKGSWNMDKEFNFDYSCEFAVNIAAQPG